ncbi:MAG: hypothetical protein R2867_39000 [Caldilineaceae bacterium]
MQFRRCSFRSGWADHYRWRIERNGTFQQSDGRYLTDVSPMKGELYPSPCRSLLLLAMMYSTPHSRL